MSAKWYHSCLLDRPSLADLDEAEAHQRQPEKPTCLPLQEDALEESGFEDIPGITGWRHILKNLLNTLATREIVVI